MKVKKHADKACEIAKSFSYKCRIEEKPPYRGYPKGNRFIAIATKSESEYYLSWDGREFFERLKKVQHKIPLAAKIDKILPVPEYGKNIVFVEKVKGKLLWELNESERPKIEEVLRTLNEFIQSIENSGIIHNDIRPWNIIYNLSDNSFKVIDWEYSEFQDINNSNETRNNLSTKELSQDRIDLDKLIKVLKKPEEADNYWAGNGYKYSWHPSPWE